MFFCYPDCFFRQVPVGREESKIGLVDCWRSLANSPYFLISSFHQVLIGG